MSARDLCPICAKPFRKSENLVKFKRWGDKSSSWIHLPCLLRLSESEELEPKRRKKSK
jgi:hypothetical protein